MKRTHREGRTSGNDSRLFIEGMERRLLLTSPVWSNFNFIYDTLEQTQEVTIDFNVNVSPSLTNSDLTLEKVNTDANVPASSILLDYNGANPATFSFTGISGSVRPHILGDGNYRASISKQDVENNGDLMTSDAIHWMREIDNV